MSSPAALPQVPSEAVEAFIARWKTAGGSECANYQLFLTELIALLGPPWRDGSANGRTCDAQ